MTSPSAPAPSHAATRAARLRRFLGRKWWAGVAGILTAVGLAWGVFAACDDQPPQQAPGNQIIGDCNAQGSANTVTCD